MTMLAALWSFEGRPMAPECERMLRAQGRGGGRSAVAEGRGTALGLAGADGEDGPVDGAGGALTLVADARLDNREDLLAQLGPSAAASAGCSDARLMMLCFERWDFEAVDRFVGDFALVLRDRRSDSLLLARDFAGQRPLFFSEAKRILAVASTARGLHAVDFVPRGVDEARLLEVLAGLPHEGRSSFFQGIERVEPGESIVFRPDRRDSRIFWTAPAGEIRLASPADYAEALTEKLDQAVAARLRGVGGALGAHLSAGLDSSAVASSAALQWPGRIHAYTSVPSGDLPSLPQGRFGDEGGLAAETAAMYPNIDHHRISTGARIPLEDLDSKLALYERSDLNLPNLAWTERINDAAAAAGVKVMLVGTTGNATISYGGPEVFRDWLAERRFGTFLAECLAARRAGLSLRTLLSAPARHFLPRPVLRAFGRLRHRDRHPASAGALNLSAVGAAETIGRYERKATRPFDSSVDVRLEMLSRVDPGSYHKGVLTRWNIDVRDPTADRRIVEFCLQVPLHQYFRNGTGRALIRAALKGRVPESVRCNRQRGLQAANWLSLLSNSTAEMRQLLTKISGSEAVRRLVNIEEMERALRSWPSNSGSYGSMSYRYGLLRGLSAGSFIRLYSSDEPATAGHGD